MSYRRRLLFVGMNLCLCACQAVGPNYQGSPTNAPASFDAAGAAPVEGARIEIQWWKGFGDPVLSALVQRALVANLGVIEAEARIREARALRRQADARFLPQIDGTADVNAQRLSEKGVALANLPPGLEPKLQLDQYRAGFDARWELDVFGRNRRSAEAAQAREGAAVESRNGVRLSVAAEVARSYADYAEALARLDAAHRSLEASVEMARLVELRRRAGEASDDDLQRAQSLANEDTAALPPLEAQAAAALYAIDRLLGVDAGSTRRDMVTAPTLQLPRVAPVGLPSELARRRPDIRRAERQLAAATADIGVATADLYPRFSLVGALGLESVELSDFTQTASRFWRVGPSLSAPLFEGGARKAEVVRREALRDAARADYRNTVLTALSEVETALVEYGKGRDRTAALSRSEVNMRRVAHLARLRYEAGEASLTTVLDVDRQAARVEDALAESRAGTFTQLIALYKALGGGWEVEMQTANAAP